MNPLSFAELRAQVLALYGGSAYAPRTAKSIERLFKQLARLKPLSSADFTTEFAGRFVVLRLSEVSANTVRGEINRFKAVCNLCVEEEWLERPPKWRRVKPRASPRRRKVLHTIDDVRRVLELLEREKHEWQSHRLLACIATAACTGARRDELLRIKVEDVHLERGVIEISARQRLKTEASAGPVPICPELEAILREWIPRTGSEWLFPGLKRVGPWTGGDRHSRAIGQIRAVGRLLGINGLTFQSLRHTFATWSRRRWGLSGIQLRDVLRHTTEHTQEHYVHEELETEALVRSVRHVSYKAAEPRLALP